MKYRTLGQGLEVSAIGIGCMPMVAGGNIVYGEANADDAIELRATGMRPPGKAMKKTAVSRDGAMIRVGPGVIEARSADGRVARIEVPETPAAARPPVPPAPPGT